MGGFIVKTWQPWRTGSLRALIAHGAQTQTQHTVRRNNARLMLGPKQGHPQRGTLTEPRLEPSGLRTTARHGERETLPKRSEP